jgi:hypothetical protein
LSWGIIAWLLALTVIGAAAGLYTFARITYRVAVGPEGGENQRIFAALNPIFAMESSLIRLVGVPTSDPHATARALDAGEVDLAIIRPDLAVPANGPHHRDLGAGAGPADRSGQRHGRQGGRFQGQGDRGG